MVKNINLWSLKIETESEIIGFARPRKGRSSKRDKAKSKCQREYDY